MRTAILSLPLLLAGGVALWLLIGEVVRWRRGTTPISGRHLVIRCLSGLLLLGLLGKLTTGVHTRLPEGGNVDSQTLTFWADCVWLAWLLIGVTAVDVAYAMVVKRRHQAAIDGLGQRLLVPWLKRLPEEEPAETGESGER